MILQGKVALVTGAGRGIGRAIVRRLALEGAHGIVNDADLHTAKATAAELEALGVQTLPIEADIADLGQVEAMVRAGLDRFGRIDILVNNAGIGGASCLTVDTPPELWTRTLAVNLTGVFNCCRTVAPHMIARRQGKIVNIASLAARRISKLGGADYTASKWGVVGFSKHLAYELASFGINVNVVCPGATLTDLVKEKTTEDFRHGVGKQVPLGRWIEPEEQADAVLFLVSDAARMITGHVIDVEGGQLLGLASDYPEDLKRRTEAGARNLKVWRGDPK
jgi:NAD(P)-dependent dehydrogenase (short-subunit alcohol dehydrogenase family)